ncbi:ABC transporter substrate-binding protein [Baekduia soli]|nr:ABC transporter substrate-binding protein [Baekduia soli]
MAAGCGGSSSSSSGGSGGGGGGGGTVKVAAINWAEGPVKDLGDAENNGIQLAFDEQNAKGGVQGKKIVLKRYDEGYAADTFIPSARKAIADGNVALIGGQEVAACSAIVQVARTKNVPVIASVCGSAGKTMDGYDRSILMRVPGEGGLTALGQWIADQGYKKVQFIGADTAFDRLTIDMFKKVFQKKGGITFANPIFAPFSSANNRVQITKAVASKPDLLYMGIFGHDIVVNGVKDARAAGYKGPIVINEAAFLQPEADALGADGNNVYGSTGWVNDPSHESATAKKFATDFKAKFGTDAEWLAENGYTAGKALIAAMDLAKSTDPNKFGPELRKIKIQTVNGDPVTIGPDGNRIAKNWYLLKSTNGKIGLGATLPLTCQASC